jgi:pyruvate dehydrogenase E1 component
MDRLQDVDPQETREWVDSLDSVLEIEGPERAHFLLESLVEKARRSGAYLPYHPNTAYINTIPPHLEERSPGDHEMEARLRSLVRWNAVAMVLRAGKKDLELGGHIASFASAATLYDVGFNHFWHGPSEDHGGDLLYIQGHSSPGVYARAFLEGRLSESQLDMFRQEVDGKGISSYPHPWLMPDFWQFRPCRWAWARSRRSTRRASSTTSTIRGSPRPATARCGRSWATARWTSPSRSARSASPCARTSTTSIFVVNCNLQRLDGPVRGNGKIIQELEADFRGAGWNVIKVIWGSYWDPLIAHDNDGLLLQPHGRGGRRRVPEVQEPDGAYVREHFFGKYPELKARVANMSDEDIWRLNRGGHDPHKIYSAYSAAIRHRGPADGDPREDREGLRHGRGRRGQEHRAPAEEDADRGPAAVPRPLQHPDRGRQAGDIPYFKPPDNSPKMQYLKDVRARMGGPLPQRRRRTTKKLTAPKLESFKALLDPTGEGREISTTWPSCAC